MELESKTRDLRKDISAVIRQGLTLFLMLIVSGFLGYLPGTDLLLFGRMPIALLLRFAIAFGMAGVLLSAYRQISNLLQQGVVALLLRGPSTRPLEASAAKVAQNATLLLYVCLLYGIVMWGGEPLVVILTAASWPFTAIRLCSLVLAVIAIIGVFVGVSPLFQETGDMLATKVTPPSEPLTAQIKCPECGVLDDGGGNYCKFCGHMLVAGAPAPAPIPPSTPCTRCGYAVTQPARFCPACGKPI